MKKYLFFPCLCLCMFLSACASSNSPSSDSPYVLPPKLSISPMQGGETVYVEVSNVMDTRADLKGNIESFLQSEAGASIVNTAENADYRIFVDIDSIQPVYLENGNAGYAGSTVWPTVVGAAIGGVTGALVSGDSGAAIGVGIGSISGLGIGVATRSNRTNPGYVWQMNARLRVEDPSGEQQSTPLIQRTSAQNMPVHEATIILENNLAWSIAKMFKN